MRVPLIRRPREERGAVAVMVGLLAVALLGMGAFTADLGMAYVNKRQLQTAADAAVLGAAGVYSETSGATSCETLRALGLPGATAEASSKVAANDNDAAPATHVFANPECTPDGLKLTVTTRTDSPSFFGRLFGKSNYLVDRSASALVSAASSVGPGTRPMALCSRDLHTLTTFPTKVMKFEGPSNGNSSVASDCPETMNPGNWWTLRCPNENSNLATTLTNGCQNPVSLVPGQPAPGDPALRDHLLSYCANPATHPESCLTSNPGNLRDSGSLTALRSLVDSGKMFFLPAFCGSPACSSGAVSTDGGNNTIYPVFRLIAVRLCGFHLGNGNGIYSNMTGPCANNPDGFNASVGGNQRNYLLLTAFQTNVTDVRTTTTCRIGDPCDTGLRQIQMTG